MHTQRDRETQVNTTHIHGVVTSAAEAVVLVHSRVVGLLERPPLALIAICAQLASGTSGTIRTLGTLVTIRTRRTAVTLGASVTLDSNTLQTLDAIATILYRETETKRREV